MAKFLTRLIIFLFPVIIVIGGAIAVAWDLGYAMPYQLIVERQLEDDRIIFMPAERAHQFAFKLYAIETLKPNILLLGSSRMAEFIELADSPHTLYNGFVDGMTTMEANWFMREIDTASYPDVIILSIDLTSLNQDHNICPGWQQADDTLPTVFENIVVETRNLWQDVLRGRVTIAQLYNSRDNNGSHWIPLGQTQLNTHLPRSSQNPRLPNTAGYHVTGARFFPTRSLDRLQQQRTHAYELLDQRNSLYTSSTTLQACERHMAALERSIQAAIQRNKTLIGTALPYSPSAYEALTTAEDLSYFPAVRQEVAELFAEYDIPYYDFSDSSQFGADDTWFSDGHHPSPLLSAKVFLAIVRAERLAFGRWIDVDALEEQINATEHPYLYSQFVELIDDTEKQQ